MHEKLKAYFDAAEKKENERIEQELINAGLYEKVGFKKVPIKITSEEYEKFKKINFNSTVKRINPVAIILEIIAWLIFIGGFIAGMSLASVETAWSHYYFSFEIALTYWAISFISGTVFLGLAEIIKLLNDIKNK